MFILFSYKHTSLHHQQYRYVRCLKKLCFILSVRSDFHMTDRLSLTVHSFASRVLISPQFIVHTSLHHQQLNMTYFDNIQCFKSEHMALLVYNVFDYITWAWFNIGRNYLSGQQDILLFRAFRLISSTKRVKKKHNVLFFPFFWV